jgi:hypothetical protein
MPGNGNSWQQQQDIIINNIDSGIFKIPYLGYPVLSILISHPKPPVFICLL